MVVQYVSSSDKCFIGSALGFLIDWIISLNFLDIAFIRKTEVNPFIYLRFALAVPTFLLARSKKSLSYFPSILLCRYPILP